MLKGFECELLEGMQQFPADDQPFVLSQVNTELLPPTTRPPLDLLEWLGQLGYRI